MATTTDVEQLPSAELRQLAESGDADAQAEMASRCYEGEGVPQSGDEAILWWTKAADQGQPRALTNLGALYFNGKLLPQDKDRGVEMLRKAAELGFAQASYQLSRVYETGYGSWFFTNEKEAFRHCQRAAELGCVPAMARLGSMYRDGYGTGKSKDEAVKWWTKAAEEGDAEAQLTLAKYYDDGLSFHCEPELAMKWCKAAADQDYIPAMRLLAYWYDTGTLEMEPDEAKAAALNRRVAELEHQAAAQSESRATAPWRAAAEAGDPAAQLQLACMYREGNGVPKRGLEALRWCQMAADQDYTPAMCLLAYMYLEDIEVVDRNEREALKWMRKAIDLGDPNARAMMDEYKAGQAEARQQLEEDRARDRADSTLFRAMSGALAYRWISGR